MSVLYLTLYGDDDETVVAECSTDPAHARPYLLVPEAGSETEIDLLQGRTTIGRTPIVVLDAPLDAANQASGWFTALLATAGGESARIGRRAKLEEAPSPGAPRYPKMDGVLASIQGEQYVYYRLELRDFREREREAGAFETSGTTTVWPRGVLAGYGRLPGGGWLVPPTRPAVGTAKTVGIGQSRIKIDRSATPKAELVVTAAMRDVLEPVWSTERARYELDGVAVLWRNVGASAWMRIDGMEVWDPVTRTAVRGVALFDTDPAEIKDVDGRKQQVDIVDFVRLFATEGGPVPADGARVEVVLLHTGKPTEQYRFHFEGTAGELLRNLYRGDYSSRPPRVRYDEAALLALTDTVRLRLPEPVEDLREWVEDEIFKPLGAAPALDDQGRIAPVRYALPSTASDLVEINNGNTDASASWVHASSDAVTRVSFTYLRDRRVPAEVDPLGEISAGDGIAERSVTIRREPKEGDPLEELVGEQELVVEPITIRALGASRGEPLDGDVQDEAGHQLALAYAEQALDRFRIGGQHITARTMRSATSDVRLGDWVLVALSWLPDYATGGRGTNRLAQVVAVREVDFAWRELRLVDAGPDNQPLGQPTLGAVTADADGLVSIPVTAVPVDGEARVDWAISPTLPPTDSPLWAYVGRTATPTTLVSPPAPAGATVWVRARGEAVGRLRSAWTHPVSVAVAPTPRLRHLRVEIGDDHVARLTWEANGFAAGVRTYYSIRVIGGSGVLTTYVDTAAAAGGVTLPGLVPAGAEIALESEPWTGWDGTAVTGTPGQRIPARQARPAEDATYAILSARIIENLETTATVELLTGIGVDEIAVFSQLVPEPYIGGTDPKETGTYMGTHVVADGRVLVTLDKPAGDFLLLVSFVPLDVDGLPRGHSKELSIPAVTVRLGERVVAVVREAEPWLADVTVSLDNPSASAFPVAWAVYVDDEDAAPIAQGVFDLDGARAVGPWDDARLSAIPLPERRPLPVIAVFQAVDGSVWTAKSFPNRDPLPWGQRTVDDYRPDARLVLGYDPDTDRIRVTLPDGRIRTFVALIGGGSYVYQVGTTVLDDGSVEDTLRVGEERGPYVVEYEGGGVWLEFFRGPLHGINPQAPSARGDYTLNAARDAALVTVTVESPVGEDLGLRFRASEDPDSTTYTMVHADDAPLYVPSGSVIPSTALFDEGPGWPVARLVIALRSGQIVTPWVQAYGRDSGVSGPWTPVPLSLKERSRLASIRGVYDPVAGQIRVELIGGPHCASALLNADNAAYIGAVTLAASLTEGEVKTLVVPIPPAQRSGTWLLRGTSYNGPLSGGAPGGVPGEVQTAAVQLPEPLWWRVAVDESNDGTQATARLYITDPPSKVATVNAFVWRGGEPKPLSPTPGTLAGDGSHWMWTVTLDPKHLWYVELRVIAADGTVLMGYPVSIDVGAVADVGVPSVSYDGAGTATIRVDCTDSDVAQCYLQVSDGSAWTTFFSGVPDATRHVVATLAQTSVAQRIRAYGVNAKGIAGPAKEAAVDPAPTSAPAAAPYITDARAAPTAGTIQQCGTMVNTITLAVSDTSAAGYGIQVEEWRPQYQDWWPVSATLPLTTTQVQHAISGWQLTYPAFDKLRTWTYRVRVVRTADGATASPPVQCPPVETYAEAC